ncbi:MAG: ammonia-forming cytochrome c nitrite reductase subunit c552 [Elusimicrobia bacterium]|nr:ammonia-forming cytochrome c nitrite reductase subunit c552 [Elusimicrobiota bacterium]
MKNKIFYPLFCLVFAACSKSADPIKISSIADKEYEPQKWQANYPAEYELWEKTKEPTPAGKSYYKKGWDTDGKIYDKLSEFPYMPLLFKGWGFGIEYNEPRGHYHMLKDVLEVDSARRKAGGVCLTCKTPYAQELRDKYGKDYFSKPFETVHSWIPKNHRELGVACVSCHKGENADLRILNDFTLGAALRNMNFDLKSASHQDMRTLVCAQCHVTYVVSKDKEMKSQNVFFPWNNSKYGKINIEDIIKTIKSDPANLEWTQAVTGFKLGFIRHPEFELFSNQSLHWKAGLSCADCHMPYVRYGSYKVSDHRVMSPLKNGLRACVQCHSQGEEWLRDRIKFTQDRTVSMLIRSGYSTAVSAKIFEKLNKARSEGKNIDKNLYDKAREYYEQAFYRIVFIGAENSLGFHNPQETLRVLADASSFAAKSEALLRQAAAQAGIYLPEKIDLELNKYLTDRGEKKLNFDSKVEFKDPFKIQDYF